MTGFRISRRCALAAGAGAAILATSWRSGSASAAAAPAVLDVFDYQGVRLLPSRWRAQQDAVLDYYLAVPTDSYLRGFRVRAGRPAPGAELGGWYSADFFNPFGQIVSGLARFYAATGRQDAKDKVHALAAGFRECIAPDLFFFYSDRPNATHYGYDKMLCGMLDAWLYCGDTNARDALTPITFWAAANLSQDTRYNSGPAEWYTLSENLYRAYLATGNTGYRDFARIWEYRGFWDHFHPAPGEDWFADPTNGEQVWWYHAYSHVNSLSGLGAGFLANGDEYYRAALGVAYDTIRGAQSFATGGYGPYEMMLKDRSTLAGLLRTAYSRNHFETQCGSWAVFKACKYLLRLTGDARFGDWAEQMLYNGVGASMQSLPDGRVQYYSDYNSRGGVKVATSPWSCCSGTRPQAVADYTDMVFLRAPGELYVNLFLPSTVDWAAAGVRARLETTFPESDVMRLTIERAPATALAVKLRAPGWLAAAPTARVNGAGVPIAADARHWLTVSRVWRVNDVLEVTLPTGARPRLVRFDPATPYPVALAQGPVTLAYGATINPARTTPPQSIVDSLQRIPGTLDYRIGATGAAVVRPYYAYQPGERYFLYLDPAAGPGVAYTGTWGDNWIWGYTRSDAAGGAAEAEFEGTGIRWEWRQFNDAGVARVEIDGRFIGTVDQFNPAEDPWRVGIAAGAQFTGLSAGRHRIKITGANISLHDIQSLGPEAAGQVGYSGPWNLNMHLAYTNSTGSAAEIELQGSGIRWKWQRFDDAGIARVEIDGRVVGTVDQYGPQRGVPAQSDFTGLGAGRHRIRVVCTGTKQAASANTYLNVQAFEPL
ncbi:beta-L-arabinofuranosidase domain-containing protein [Allorhizocola rhizosphaerae]|uniref:beta-L-arabinofuranosidase domain-containing protein n=1 Tax=Allorhizocola rhizosphaerae TaxID=1872709 RepID=UPI0013C32EA4|nr:beta-L-arabinofuranosidase domain-containing protein [Allorhizocola rhizosphaerae]